MNAAVGAAGASVVAFIILFSITGAANGNVLTAPRVFFAMARDGIFFKPLASLHPKTLTPNVSIIATAAWASVLCLSGTFEQLASYVIFGQWIFFGLTVAAVIVLRFKRPDLARPYRTWGYPVTPVLFILAALFIAFNTLANQPLNALAGLGIIVLGIPTYFVWKLGTSRTRGICGGVGVVIAVPLLLSYVAVTVTTQLSFETVFRALLGSVLIAYCWFVVGWVIGLIIDSVRGK
jgi:amino acid transporter